jgi:hypothetical protein
MDVTDHDDRLTRYLVIALFVVGLTMLASAWFLDALG